MTPVQTIMLELVVMRASRSPLVLLLLQVTTMQQLMRETMMMLMMSMKMMRMTTMMLDKVCDVTELSRHVEVSSVCLRSAVGLADISTNGCKTVCTRLLFMISTNGCMTVCSRLLFMNVFMIHIDYMPTLVCCV